MKRTTFGWFFAACASIGLVGCGDSGQRSVPTAVPADQTFKEQGDYEVQGDRILLESDNAGTAWASIEGGLIILPADVLGDGTLNEYVFRR